MDSIHTRRLSSRYNRTASRFVAEAESRGAAIADLPGIKLPWFQVRNADGASGIDQDEPGTASVFIFDEIGGSAGVDANELVRDLEAITAPEIKVRINSPGGSMFDSIAISNALRHHSSRVTTYVDGIAASGASIIAVAGDEVVMMPGSQMMIHDAGMMQDGNAEDMRAASVFLDRQSDVVAGVYQVKGGGDAADWRELMQAETWMFAREAVTLGLADRVFDKKTDPAVPAEDLLTRSFDMSQFRYAGRPAAPDPTRGRQPRETRQARTQPTTTTPRAPAPTTREAAAQARRTAFESGVPTADPATGAQARQVRGQVAGTGDARIGLRFPTRLTSKTEARNGKTLYHLTGIASVFDRTYPMWDIHGEYDEVVTRGAADKTLASDPDVSFLVNHKGVTMARTLTKARRQAGNSEATLILRADGEGLHTEAWVNPDRSDVQILISAVDDGLVDEMSFAFMIPEGGGVWSSDFTRFEIRQIDIDRGDVSAVNYGANPYTSIAARTSEIMGHLEHLPVGARRAAMASLERSLTDRHARRAAADDLDHDTSVLSAPTLTSRPTVPKGQGRSLSVIESLLDD